MRYLIIAAILLASCSNEPEKPITGVVTSKAETKYYTVTIRQDFWPYTNERSISEEDYNKIVIGERITIDQGKAKPND